MFSAFKKIFWPENEETCSNDIKDEIIMLKKRIFKLENEVKESRRREDVLRETLNKVAKYVSENKASRSMWEDVFGHKANEL